MTAKEKATLVKQAGALYTLGLKVEKQREKLRRLVSQNIPYDSPQMRKVLDEFNAVDREWKRLEFEHLQFKVQMGKSKDIFIKKIKVLCQSNAEITSRFKASPEFKPTQILTLSENE